jgi:hypothetical protein
MPTEHLHQTLSPRAYAALFDALRRQAERERRAELQRVGGFLGGRLQALAQGFVAHRGQGAPAQLMEG